MSRATRDDWLTAALEIIAGEGAGALTIDRLCRAMAKTKGGFYHHFGDAAGLREAILDRWEQRQTTAIIEAADAQPTRTRRAQVIDALATAADWGEERAIRSWAWRDEAVRGRVEAVDRRRIDYLCTLYAGVPKRRARELATLEYAALVGAQQLFHVSPDPKLGALLREALDRQARADARRRR